MHIIVGLGNPGKKYEETRHNTGFMVVDFLAEQKGLTWQFNKKFNAEIIKTNDLILVKPQTYMNNSGMAVRAILDYYKLLPKPARGWSALSGKLGLLTIKNSDLSDKLIIIHDDVDFNLGVFKIQKNRSAGGHNGIKSIITYLKTQNFTRIRVGIASQEVRLLAGSRTPKKMSTEKFVLDNFSKEEMKILKQIIPTIINSI